jgi:hypothetical protein
VPDSGGDIHKLGPPLYPHPRSLLFECSLYLKDRKDSKMVKLIEFLIEEGVDVNFETDDVSFLELCLIRRVRAVYFAR